MSLFRYTVRNQMRILITTQAVDLDDPVLGFFHEWVVQVAKRFAYVHVICLKEGRHDLPPNVQVYSLGKEEGESRFKYVTRFYSYVWKLRKDVDVVFSHMNPHYIVLAGLFWKLWGIRMYLWRNHKEMNFKTRIAVYFSKHVFYTSSFACLGAFRHAVQMPVGINTHIFNVHDETITRIPRSILFLGRLSRIKRPELFLESVRTISEVRVDVYGETTPDLAYTKDELGRMGGPHVVMHGSVKNSETPHIYRTHELYVNLTPEGSMDKTVLEAAACGALVLVYNKSFRGIVPDVCLLPDDHPETIRERIEMIFALPPTEKEALRQKLTEVTNREHSLDALLTKLLEYIHD